jgi:MoaA/NifB/PqqE/SkfB family radical SAM enzyme
LELIRQAKKHKIYTATSTNAHFIDQKKAEEIIDSGLDRLIISIDGLTQETYENYRVHGELSKVIEASKHLIAAKKEKASATPHLIFQFLAVKPNEHEIPAVFTLGSELGIDEVRIKTAQLYDYKHGNPLMPSKEEYSRYRLQKDGTLVRIVDPSKGQAGGPNATSGGAPNAAGPAPGNTAGNAAAGPGAGKPAEAAQAKGADKGAEKGKLKMPAVAGENPCLRGLNAAR